MKLAEAQKNCKYCHFEYGGGKEWFNHHDPYLKPVDNYGSSGSSHHAINWIDGSNNHYYLFHKKEEFDGAVQTASRIFCCPICGRKLGKEAKL
ncbi:hypothetical protein PS376_03285 [Limosilactobacillus pontis]